MSVEAISGPAWKPRHPAKEFVLRQPSGALGLALIVLMIGAAALAPVVAPYHPLATDFLAQLKPPSAAHLFGTDTFGRDILSRILYGARTALAVGLLSALFGCLIGASIGIASAYFGGWFDLIVQALTDMMLSFPLIILAVVIVAAFGHFVFLGIDWVLVAAIAIPQIPKVARVARSSTLSVRQMGYIDAARLAGYSHGRIIFRHIAPNIVAPFLILFTAFIGQGILLEASLSFLGLGVHEPTPSWGLMLSGSSAEFYRKAPWIVIFPGAVLSLSVLAFNLFGDSLRDWLDPKIKL